MTATVLRPTIYDPAPGEHIGSATAEARRLGCQFLLFNDCLIPANWTGTDYREYPNLGQVAHVLKYPDRDNTP